MDGIPDEILQSILNYAMITDAPFCAETRFRMAELLDIENKMAQDDDPRRPEALALSLGYQLSIDQRPHLLDWRAVVGTCRRFRRVGKSAFFSQKVFVMGPRLASRLQNLQVGCLSVEDQQMAVKSIRSIIWIVDSTSSPSEFLTLSRHMSAFPRLIRLDFLFDYWYGDSEKVIVKAAQDRRQAWSHFTDGLALAGVSVERLDVGVMKNSVTTWSSHEIGLKYNIYPALRTAASMKAKYVRK